MPAFRGIVVFCLSYLAMAPGAESANAKKTPRSPPSSVNMPVSSSWLSMDGEGYVDASPDKAMASIRFRGKSDSEKMTAEANLRSQKSRALDLVRDVLGEEPEYAPWVLQMGLDVSPEHGYFGGEPWVATMTTTFPIRDVSRAFAFVNTVRERFDKLLYDWSRLSISAKAGISPNSPEAVEAHGKALADAVEKARAEAERKGIVIVGEPLPGEYVDSFATTAAGDSLKSRVNVLWKVAPPEAR